jgi:hypothetical protein
MFRTLPRSRGRQEREMPFQTCVVRRHCRLAVPILALSLVQAAALAQTVDFRIVERTGQTQITAADNVLDFAVQARVTSTNNSALAAYGFTVHIAGEPDSSGQFARELISNFDGTYATTIATNSAIGRGGLPLQYSYLAAINANFNGLINASAATFTNGPDQEIALVTGAALGSALLSTPGMDADGDGNPDTWTGNGTGQTPPDNLSVPVNTTLTRNYMARANYIDVYRFRYTVTDFSPRTLHFQLDELAANAFTRLTWIDGTWGPVNSALPASSLSFQATDILVPGPGAAGVAAAGMGVLMSRRRRHLR